MGCVGSRAYPGTGSTWALNSPTGLFCFLGEWEGMRPPSFLTNPSPPEDRREKELCKVFQKRLLLVPCKQLELVKTEFCSETIALGWHASNKTCSLSEHKMHPYLNRLNSYFNIHISIIFYGMKRAGNLASF